MDRGRRPSVPVPRPINNETPKPAPGDREPEWAFLAQIPHTETKPGPRNGAVPCRLRRIHIVVDGDRTGWLGPIWVRRPVRV
jgi:hypothetical protein